MTHSESGRHSRADGRSAGAGTVRIAVDLLGGDNAPAVVVDGALQACHADPDLHLVLVGPRLVADEVFSALNAPDRARVTAIAAERGVAMGGPAAHGADPETSIAAAVLALATGRVDAVVSAGASGATVAAAVLGLGRLGGIRRPALAALLPLGTDRSSVGPTRDLVLLDVGAGLQVKPTDLIQHAILGADYSRRAGGVARPRVGLLSVGAEPGKGDRLRRSVDATLRTQDLADAIYVGPVEGHDVVAGARADVIVTDGFTGNVLLKAIEATLALAAAPGTFPPAVVPRAAALLGVAGTVVVCHGAANGADIASGFALAAELVRGDVIAAMVSAAGPPTPTVAGHTQERGAVRLTQVPT